MKIPVMATIIATTLAATSCCGNKGEQASATLDKANLDTTAVLNDDFYQYACGGWMVNNPLKAEYSRFGTFDLLRENSKEQLKSLIDELGKTNHETGTIAQKIGDLYNLGLDSVRLNNEGATPLADGLAEIMATSSDADVAKIIAKMHRMGMAPFFHFFADADAMNSSMNIAGLYQGGMNMGDRDYYLLDDDATLAIQDSYNTYIKQLFTLSGYSQEEAEAAAKAVMAIETELAKAAFTRIELRDPHANYNKMSGAELIETAPGFDWESYLTALNMSEVDEINAMQLPFIKRMSELIVSTPANDMQYYLAFNYMDGAASCLSDEMVTAQFDFYEKALSGVEEQQPRWKRALNATNSAISEGVGEMYVAKYFPPASKQRVETLVANLATALGQHIDALSWMSDATKEKAHEKLSTFHVKIGYPNTWRDYSPLVIDNTKSYFENMVSAKEFDYDIMLSEIGKPVDKDKWLMSPQTVNAYYNPSTNEICFPAAILQPPFFYPEGDDAINYGGIGVVIGHEMTHGFDDQGRAYDKDGNLAEWWTEEDSKQFEAKATALANYFDNIVVLDTVHANGRFTLGENIADQGGLRVSYTAFQNSKTADAEEVSIDGFTPNQRFFLSYATLWAGNIRDAEILRLTKVDPHSLGRWRVNGALPHVDAFYEAFDIKEGDGMYIAPEERAVIW